MTRVKRRIEAAPFPRSIGVKVRVSRGRATATAPVRPDSKQVHGLAHGGWIATLADTCQTAAAFSAVREGQEILTTDFTLRFLRGLTRGPARAEARVVKAGRRVVVVQAEVYDRDGEHVATGTFANLVL
jgi:uncharacterized protein (TIGR00369 family)